MQAKNGLYCAPLRLLAWEIQQKLEDKNIPCNLITGQEKIIRENADFTSCTVELASRKLIGSESQTYEVACIDEIQMIADQERGAAWTALVLGLKAKIIYLMGDPRALQLINKLCTLCGDELEEKKFIRLSDIVVEKKLFDISMLQPGDCIISFRIKDLINLRKMINNLYKTKKNTNVCSIIYGRLPPEVRKDQAKFFNEGCNSNNQNNSSPNFQYLVATNAIGMGLNLNIKRIIFSTLQKTGADGQMKQIENHEIIQIAGRAGRYKDEGVVLCMKKSELKTVKQALYNNREYYKQQFSVEEEEDPENQQIQNLKKIDKEDENNNIEKIKLQQLQQKQEIQSEELAENENDEVNEQNLLNRPFSQLEKQIKKAGIFPTFDQINDFRNNILQIQQQKIDLADTFRRLMAIAQIEGIYFIQRYKDFCYMASLIEHCGMDLKDQYKFCQAPLSLKKTWNQAENYFVNFAQQYAKNKKILFPELDLNQFKNTCNESNLNQLEQFYHIIEIYAWLSYKFNSQFKYDQSEEMKERICKLINMILQNRNQIEK